MAPIQNYTIVPLKIYTKSAWSDPWTEQTGFVPIGGSDAVEGVGEFTFVDRYGEVKLPDESAISTRAYSVLGRSWVRVLSDPYSTSEIVFQGRIVGDNRKIFGGDSGAASGVVEYHCYDGVDILNKVWVNSSMVNNGSIESIDHVLAFNKQLYSTARLKNRSASQHTRNSLSFYTFGLSTYWNVKDAIEYLIGAFVAGDSSATDPEWTVDVPTELSTAELEPISFGSKQTLLSMLNEIVGRQSGYSWRVVPTDTGFTFKVVSLAAADETFESYTVVANPDTVTASVDDPADISIVSDFSQVYGRVRVVGSPMIVCKTFAPTELDFEDITENGEVTGKRITVSSLNTSLAANDLPTVQDDGTLDDTTRGPLPLLMKNTLESLPLEQGISYVTPSTSVDELDTSKLIPPFVFVRTDPNPYYRYYFAEDYGSVYTLPDEVGVVLRDGNAGDIDEAETFVTLAFQGTQSLQSFYEVPGAIDADGEFVMEVPNAQLHYAAHDTVYSIESNEGKTVYSTNLELRNDYQKLHRIMAGIIVRYVKPRYRVSINYKELKPSSLIGKILTTVSDGDSGLYYVNAPITSIQWSLSEAGYSTTITTGFGV